MIIGEAGYLEGFFIVFISTLVTFCTSLSISTLATNGKITGGGSYFIISRSLGPSFGGSVGLLFSIGFTTGGAM